MIFSASHSKTIQLKLETIPKVVIKSTALEFTLGNLAGFQYINTYHLWHVFCRLALCVQMGIDWKGFESEGRAVWRLASGLMIADISTWVPLSSNKSSLLQRFGFLLSLKLDNNSIIPNIHPSRSCCQRNVDTEQKLLEMRFFKDTADCSLKIKMTMS